MILKTTSCYNPFYVEVNGRAHFLNSISVFNAEGKIIAKQNSGWFGSNNYIGTLELDCDCVLKRKVDYKVKSAFIVRSNNPIKAWDESAMYDLYIPASVMKLSAPTYSFCCDNTMVYRSVVSAVDNRICFEQYVSVAKNDVSREYKEGITLLNKEYSTLTSARVDVEGFRNLLAQLNETLNTAIAEYNKVAEAGAESYAYLFD